MFSGDQDTDVFETGKNRACPLRYGVLGFTDRHHDRRALGSVACRDNVDLVLRAVRGVAEDARAHGCGLSANGGRRSESTGEFACETFEV